MRELLQKWCSTFEHWRKFTNVFASQEAKKTLEKELDAFRTMGKCWRSITGVVKIHTHVIDILNQPKVIKWLTKCKRLLLFIIQVGQMN